MSQTSTLDLRDLTAQHFVNQFRGSETRPQVLAGIDAWSRAMKSAQTVHNLLELWLSFNKNYGCEECYVLLAHDVGLGALEFNHFFLESKTASTVRPNSALLLERVFNDAIIKLGLNSSCCHVQQAESQAPDTAVAAVWPWRHPSGVFGLFKCVAAASTMTSIRTMTTTYITPWFLERLSALLCLESRTGSHALTQREIDVLDCLAKGLSALDASKELQISRNTIDSHTKNIYRKLGVNNRQQAIIKAREDLSRHNRVLMVAQ